MVEIELLQRELFPAILTAKVIACQYIHTRKLDASRNRNLMDEPNYRRSPNGKSDTANFLIIFFDDFRNISK